MGYIFDGANKIISLTTGTTSVSVRDLWSRYSDWVPVDDNSKYELAMRFVGGDALPGDKELGLTYFMTNNWKIRPYSGNHTLNIDGNLYSDDGSSPYTNVLGSYNVMLISSVSSLVDSTIQQLPEIEYASYNGGVTLDVVNGTDSSEYPYGTPNHPCKTISNSYNIRMARGFKKVFLRSDLHLIGIPDGILNDLELVGVTGFKTHLVTGSNVLLTNCSASNLKITGVAKPGSTLKLDNCDMYNLENANVVASDCFIYDGLYNVTELFRCRVEGDITVVDGGNFSGVNVVFNGDFSSIDCMGSMTTVSLDIDSGYVKILNSVESCLLEFNLRGGELEIDDSCIGGDLYIEGYGKLYNTSAVNIKANNLQTVIIPDAVWDVQTSEHQLEGSVAEALTNGMGSSLTKEDIREEIDSNSSALSNLRRLSAEIHRINGLDKLNPTTVTKESRISGDIEQDFALDYDGNVTITRR